MTKKELLDEMYEYIRWQFDGVRQFQSQVYDGTYQIQTLFSGTLRTATVYITETERRGFTKFNIIFELSEKINHHEHNTKIEWRVFDFGNKLHIVEQK